MITTNLVAGGRTPNTVCMEFQKYELMSIQNTHRPFCFGNKLKRIILMKVYDFIYLFLYMILLKETRKCKAVPPFIVINDHKISLKTFCN